MLIIDPSLEPYLIKVEKSNFEVYKRMTPKKSEDGSDPKPYNRYHSCHSGLLQAVDCIIGLKIEANKSAVSLIEYIKEIRKLKELFLSVTHDDIDKRFVEISRRIDKLDSEVTKSLSEIHSKLLKS